MSIIAPFVINLPVARAEGDTFTQKDRELLIRLDERLDQIDKRFEQVDKRFEQSDKRFESLQTMMMAMVGAFAAIVAVTIGFAIWDRRTMAKPFEYKIQENSRKIDEIVDVLKELGRHDERIATVLRSIFLL